MEEQSLASPTLSFLIHQAPTYWALLDGRPFHPGLLCVCQRQPSVPQLSIWTWPWGSSHDSALQASDEGTQMLWALFHTEFLFDLIGEQPLNTGGKIPLMWYPVPELASVD